MTTLDTRFMSIEDRLGAIERDLAEIKGRLEIVPTPWLLISLVLPLYGLLILGFAGVFYFLLNYAR